MPTVYLSPFECLLPCLAAGAGIGSWNCKQSNFSPSLKYCFTNDLAYPLLISLLAGAPVTTTTAAVVSQSPQLYNQQTNSPDSPVITALLAFSAGAVLAWGIWLSCGLCSFKWVWVQQSCEVSTGEVRHSACVYNSVICRFVSVIVLFFVKGEY